MLISAKKSTTQGIVTKILIEGERSADQPDVKGWGGLGTTSGGFSRPEQVRLMISSDWSRYGTDYMRIGILKLDNPSV